jgi:hypothetical protein
MKKTIFTVLWMLAFFMVGFVIFIVFGSVMVRSIPHPADPAPSELYKAGLITVVDWLGPIGLPILALVLGIFGKLPGTRSHRQASPT